MRRVSQLALIALLVGACGSSPSSTGPTSGPPSASALSTPTPAATGTVEPSAATPVPTSTQPKPTATADATAKPSTSHPLPIVTATTFTSKASDGRWKATFQMPVVANVPTTVASAANAAIRSSVNQFVAEFTRDGLPPAEGGQPSELDGEYSVAYVDPALLSLRLRATTYTTGAAHPNAVVRTLNLDLATGSTLALADEFTDVSAALGILSSQSRSGLEAQFGADLPADQINSGTTPVAANFAAWAFTSSGFEITFADGQVGPHAIGTPTVTIPWTALSPVVKPGSAASLFSSFSG